MPASRRSFADPSDSPATARLRSRGEDFDLHQGARANSLPLRALTAAEFLNARAAVTAHATDDADEAMLLDALGLNPHAAGERVTNAGVTRFTHGTRSAAEAHYDADTALCKACQRWADVEARKSDRTALRAFDPALCGSRAGAQQHDDFDQERCDPCREADNAYHRELHAIRVWCRENGYLLGGAGRIPTAIRMAYQAAQSAGEG